MKRKIKALIMTVVMALSGLVTVSAASVAHVTSVSGVVESTAVVGQTVKEGDVLVTVQSLVGPVPAARATVNGVVVSLAVTAGTTVSQGQEVAVVEAK